MIVYVHGALSTRRSFSYIAKELKAEGLSERYFGYDIRTTSGSNIAQDLVTFVKKVNPKEPVLFIAHSYGGVVSVEAARMLSSLDCSVLSMASPFGGSAVASYLKVFKPSSHLLNNVGSYNTFMKNFMAKPLPCRVRGLVTTAGAAEWSQDANDGVVTVASQLHFEQDPNWAGVRIEANHFEVLLLPKSVELIRKELKRLG